jgi:hypothetical protein
MRMSVTAYCVQSPYPDSAKFFVINDTSTNPLDFDEMNGR